MTAKSAGAFHIPAYADNPLIDRLGDILPTKEAMKRLTFLPPAVPKDIDAMPMNVRWHFVLELWHLYLPSLHTEALHETIDAMRRRGLCYRRPGNRAVWRELFRERRDAQFLEAPPLCISLVGVSGTGKTEAAKKCVALVPQQVAFHQHFPGMKDGLRQLTWLRADVHESGKSEDLAANLMSSFDEAMESDRFKAVLGKKRRDGAAMLDEWTQVASSHFLGILHLDEVQNFFKIPPLDQRRSKKSQTSERAPLRVVEDTALKAVLSMINTWRMPFIFSGTPDGMAALSMRLSTCQRLVTCGRHVLSPITDVKNVFYATLFPVLASFQWVKKRMEDTPAFRALILELTGGVPRIIITLWVMAHRVAFDERKDELSEAIFRKAMDTYLAPLKPAVEALRSGSVDALAKYEDLLPRQDAFWANVNHGVL